MAEKMDIEPDQPVEVVHHPDTERTPGWLRDHVDVDFKITFDPENQLEDPLNSDWQGFSFVHPPHSEAEMWCEKAAMEAVKGNFSVLLVPAVFNSCYWRKTIYPCATEVRMFTCPIKMPNAKKQIVSQMALVVFAGTGNREEGYPYPPMFPIEPANWQEHYYKRFRNRARFGHQ